ncbi:MAG: hypothetical protein ACJAUD_002035 [Crocinitomicaceae bacterium]|jgi:hypothetical protein
MKTSLLLLNCLFIGVFLFVTSCEVKSDESIKEKDPERLELAQKEKRRREDILRRAEYDEYYDEYEDEEDYYDDDYYEYDISSDEEEIDNKWRRVDYQDYEAYYEYGYSNQALEGMVFIEKVGESIHFPDLQIGDKAAMIERTFNRNFPNHPASGFTCSELDLGSYHDITLYRTKSKGSTYVDVEAIYSVDIDGEMFIILVENGGNVTQDFLNNYEDFVEQLFIMK